jgi:hypothetical protein
MAQAALGFAQLQCGERASGLLLLEAWAHHLGVGFGRIGYSWLARAYGSSGDAEAAVAQIDEGLALSGQTTSLSELSLLVERAHWLVAAGRTLEDEALQEALLRVREVIDRTGAVVHSPQLSEIEARAASLAGNDALHRERLDEALRLYREVGATGHVDRLEGESGG